MAKKPAYRLQALFDIREKAKGEAEDFYAGKQKELVVEVKKHEAMKEKLREMIQAREDKKRDYTEKLRKGELNITQIQGNDRHLDRMKQEEAAYQVDIARQAEQVKHKEAEVADAKELMLKANQDFKALEKHKEKWEKAVKREAMLKEEDAVEDIAQAQYFARLQDRRED
jgi:flagellar biosynthesis chaperone FliJ